MRTHCKFFPVLSVLFFACGSPQSAPGPSGSAGIPSETDTFAAQVERGGALYGTHCASCHGDSGEGGSAPAVVGEGVLPLDPPTTAKHRKVQFATALDVFLWVKETMPADDPGSLTDKQYVDILAFDLMANGVTLETPLDGEVAKGLKLH